ncbi:Purple acid phosphatase 15 [Citrus sinensis]|uniref:Purple acid phosphatase 15 n=1 Tax=Citrus sinensis TaxID=2711 RepID=A0ACB8I174_CITSI|nr:Purple acid phosphatase 15 [Citrus sinensis]
MAMAIPTTLDGPFKPVTIPLDKSFRGNAIDLPDTDPRVQRTVEGFEPEQISVSLSSTHDSVWISWITGEFQIGNNIKPLDPKIIASVVRYATRRSQLNRKATGHSLVYNQLYPFLGLQNYTSGIIHHVRLTGLKPDTLYYYQCGDPSIPAMSGTYYFRTMPDSSPTSYPSKIAIVGDQGLTYNTTSTVNHMISNRPDLILLVGDVTYSNLYLTNGTGSNCYSCSFANSPIHETYQPRWDYWGRYMQPVLSKVPIMVVEGNHEWDTFYNARLDFDIYIYITGDQYKWLEEDLVNVDREVTPWLVVTWHAPWYNTYKAHYREAECMRVVAMEDGVDVVFNGHVHAYERSNRVYNYTLDPCGPIHITVGDGGNREKMAVPYADELGNCPEPSTTLDKILGGGKFCGFNFTLGPATGKFCWDRQPDYSAFRESTFGHGILEVKNETHALWTWHRNQDFYGAVGDQIYIVRQPDWCPVEPKVMKL